MMTGRKKQQLCSCDLAIEASRGTSHKKSYSFSGEGEVSFAFSLPASLSK
jgi:hypothetical protein